jgi:hypothetical protein
MFTYIFSFHQIQKTIRDLLFGFSPSFSHSEFFLIANTTNTNKTYLNSRLVNKKEFIVGGMKQSKTAKTLTIPSVVL